MRKLSSKILRLHLFFDRSRKGFSGLLMAGLVLQVQPGETLIFHRDLNGRKTEDVRKETANIAFTIPKGTEGSILSFKPLNHGNYALEVSLRTGTLAGKRAWIFYDVKAGAVKLYSTEQVPASLPSRNDNETRSPEKARSLETVRDGVKTIGPAVAPSRAPWISVPKPTYEWEAVELFSQITETLRGAGRKSKKDCPENEPPAPMTAKKPVVEEQVRNPAGGDKSRAELFGPFEKCDLNKPECLDRILAAFQYDPITKKLLEEVMEKLGVKDPRELLEIPKQPGGLESGSATLEPVTEPTGAVLPGWPAVASDGSLLFDKNPVMWARIKMSNSEDMITTYSTLVHELTHIHGGLTRCNHSHLMDALNYSSPEDYANQKVKELGGERDAFAAEISAVIRYRTRTKASFEAFRTPIRERYFDARTGELLDRDGLERDVLYSGIGYMRNYSDTFKRYLSQEISYTQQSIDSLGSIAPADLNEQQAEELKRLRVRLERLKQRG